MVHTANIHEAKTNLSRLIERALAGEEVVIARAGKPVVRLEPVKEAKPEPGAWIGSFRGHIEIPDNFEFTDEEIEELFYAPLESLPLAGVAEPGPEET